MRKYLLLVTLPIILTGCSLGNLPLVGGLFGGGKPSEVTLTYWGLWEPKEVMDSLISEYQSENPHVTIEYQERSFSDLESYKETLLTRLKLDNEDSVDIMRIHNSWIPEFASELSSIPPEVLSTQDYVDRFYPISVKSATVGESLYAIPLEYDALALFYNEEMFRDAGISTPPQTWEEFRLSAIKLKKMGEGGDNIKIAGAAIGTADNISHAADILGLMWAQSSVDIPDDLDSQAAADALVFYSDLSMKDRVWDDTFPYSIIAFANQKVAMIIAPSWRALDILNLNPTLKFGSSAVPQVPSLEGGTSSVHWASFWMEAVSKGSSSTVEAWRFLEWLSQNDQQQKLFSESSKIRAFGEPYANKNLSDSLSVSKYLAPVAEGAPFAKSGIITDQSGNEPYVEAILTAIRAVSRGSSAKSALTTAQQEIESLLGRAGPSSQ